MNTEPLNFAVIRFVEGWRVIADGRRWGRFDYQVDAVDAALRLIAKAGRDGRSARLLVQSLTGEISLENVA